MARTSAAFSSMTGQRPGSPACRAWRRSYQRYVFIDMPAQLTAVARTAVPPDIAHRIRLPAGPLQDLFPAPGIIALSRTGASFAVPWLLARQGARVTVIADPAERARQLFAAIATWPTSGELHVMDSDRRALLRARRILAEGSYLALYPEFAPPSRHDIGVPFLHSTLAVSQAVAKLSIITGAPIVPACGFSDGRDIVVEAGARLEPQGATCESLTQELFAQFSLWAGAHAEQWLGWEYLARTFPHENGGTP